MLNKFFAKGMSRMIADFFFIDPPASKICFHDLNNFITICDKIGLPLNPCKTCLPNTNIIVYGIEVDIAMEWRLLNDKVFKILIAPGRTCLLRLIDLTVKVTNPWHIIRLTCKVRADFHVGFS